MRYSKHELESLANQSPNKYEKEGLLSFRERCDGFFRRNYSKLTCAMIIKSIEFFIDWPWYPVFELNFFCRYRFH